MSKESQPKNPELEHKIVADESREQNEEYDYDKIRARNKELKQLAAEEELQREQEMLSIKEGLTPKETKNDKSLFGDFKTAELNESKKINLSGKDQEEVKKNLKQLKSRFKFSPPSLLKGARTATEYDSRARNFSTRTAILTLDDGKKIFAVYNYPLSWLHRAMDALGKRLSGDKMQKANSRDWKQVFESRSNIPVIENSDPNVVLMPYLPNVNAYDLFARDKEIKDFGPCPWGRNLTLDDKLRLGEQIIDEIQKIHESGRTWGETILPNIIVTSEKRPVIVDPETQYDADISSDEQKARDLKDILMSIAGALHASDDVENYDKVINTLLSRYRDKKVINELKTVIAKKQTLIQKIFRAFYETQRLCINIKEYEKVAKAVLEYSS